MKKLEFSIEIKAPKEKVWDVLWNDETYRKWTSTFLKGSYIEGDLQEGKEVRFLSPGEHGLFGVTEKIVQYKTMHFKHFGEVLDGVSQEITFGDEAIEYYDLEELVNGTKLVVTLNTTEEFIIYFTSTFPRALNAVKEISEA